MQKITFLNEPKLSGTEHNKDQDERRIYLVGEIRKFLSKHPSFKDWTICVYFFHVGVSSLVCKLEIEQKTLILKIQIRPNGPRVEGLFLKTWEENNISVPHMIEDGYIGEHYYISMNNIDAPYAQKDLVDDAFFFEMGTLLKKIHSIPATGFGKLKEDGEAQYKDFKSWITKDEQIQNQTSYIFKNNILPEDVYVEGTPFVHTSLDKFHCI